MTHSARENSHVSSACVNCRRRKKKCSGSRPTCALCAEKNVQCEWTVDGDGRRGCGRERDALKLENYKLKGDLALLQARLRGAGVENVHDGLTYHAVQAQQLQLWLHEVAMDCAGLAVGTSVAQQAAAPAGAFAATTTHALTLPTDSWRYSYPAQDGPPGTTEESAGPSAEGIRLHAVNVFGPHVPPLSTSYAIPQEFYM